MQPVIDFLYALADRRAVFLQNVYNRLRNLQRLHADTDRQAGLTVQIDQQHVLARSSQRSAQIVRRGRLRHAAFLICYCDYFHCSISFLFYLYTLFIICILYNCQYIKEPRHQIVSDGAALLCTSFSPIRTLYMSDLQ